MATQAARTFTLRPLVRRFAGQVLLSGAVMLTLNTASRLDLGLGEVHWPGFADESAVALPRREAMVLPSLALPETEIVTQASAPSRDAVAQATRPTENALPASVREARLPVPARLFAEASAARPDLTAPARKPAAPVRMAAFEPALVKGVLLFDQCQPACETRDPLAQHTQADHTARKSLPPTRTRMAELQTVQQPSAVEAAMDVSAEPAIEPPTPAADRPGLLTRSLSTARDTTLQAAGSLARLVSW